MFFLLTGYFKAEKAGDLKAREILIKTGGFLSLNGRMNIINPGLKETCLKRLMPGRKDHSPSKRP
jgi:hypothetical protein